MRQKKITTLSEWDAEGDLEVGKSQGFDYRIVRHPVMKHLCGYVGVPRGHPLHGLGYGHDDLSGVDVHGGLTFADGVEPGTWTRPAPQGLWWFGFDCAQWGDLVPAMLARGYRDYSSDRYRNMPFVRVEISRLADFLLDAQRRVLP